MPKVFLSPSTQEYNSYVSGGNEELYMNLLADRLEPYLRASGIKFVRNDPDRTFAGAIQDSNSAYYDVHLALHSNAAPDRLSGRLRGIDIYFAPKSSQSEKLANIIANNLKSIYPLPDKVRAVPTYTLGEVLNTKAVAVLCELGYHDNYADEAWIKSELGSIAANIARSVRLLRYTVHTSVSCPLGNGGHRRLGAEYTRISEHISADTRLCPERSDRDDKR